MKRILSMVTAAGLLAGALLLPSALLAHDTAGDKPKAHGDKKEGMEDRREKFAARLREKFGISADQEAKLKVARETLRDASAAAIKEHKAASVKLKEQIEKKAPDADLSATLDTIAAARAAIRESAAKYEAASKTILTPTQRANMLLALREHGRGARERWGKRGHGKRGGPRHDDENHDEHDELEDVGD